VADEAGRSKHRLRLSTSGIPPSSQDSRENPEPGLGDACRQVKSTTGNRALLVRDADVAQARDSAQPDVHTLHRCVRDQNRSKASHELDQAAPHRQPRHYPSRAWVDALDGLQVDVRHPDRAEAEPEADWGGEDAGLLAPVGLFVRGSIRVTTPMPDVTPVRHLLRRPLCDVVCLR